MQHKTLSVLDAVGLIDEELIGLGDPGTRGKEQRHENQEQDHIFKNLAVLNNTTATWQSTFRAIPNEIYQVNNIGRDTDNYHFLGMKSG